MNQQQRIIEYMRERGSITSREAMRELGVMRLASRISDLRQAGYAIYREMETGKNRYDEPTRYARYYLREEGDKRYVLSASDIRVHHRRGERNPARDRDRVDMVHKPCGVKK